MPRGHRNWAGTEFMIIAGLSGAGRTQAAHTLEDRGWFVIDNLPPSLITRVAELAIPHSAAGGGQERLALVASSTRYLDDLLPAIAHLRERGARVRVLFLDASDETLVKRFEITRRRHPFADSDRVTEGIEREREALAEVKAAADVVVDTSDLNVHQLHDRLIELFADTTIDEQMSISVMSFGYTNGLPRDADLVFDCRFLPNPHWVPELRPLTGLDEPVRRYVLDQPATIDFLSKVQALLVSLVPQYVHEGKAYLTIAIGCTGGRHRSVAVAEEIGSRLNDGGVSARVSHRDIERSAP